jgi:uncharacterized protein (TIGR00106 family)
MISEKRTKSPQKTVGATGGPATASRSPLPSVPPPEDTTILLEFSMSPLTKGDSVSKYVAGSLEIIDQSGLDYRLNPMGTVIEGDWDEVLGVVKSCWSKMAKSCDRITTIIKIDYRKGHRGRLTSKVKSVEQHLKKKLKTE